MSSCCLDFYNTITCSTLLLSTLDVVYSSTNYNVDPRHVVLLMDEMKVREDLVFDRNGEVIGYVDIGDINNSLRKLEKSCKTHSNT